MSPCGACAAWSRPAPTGQRPRLRVCRWSDRGLVAMFKFHSPFDAWCSGERRARATRRLAHSALSASGPVRPGRSKFEARLGP